jgi:hypothetical protein
MGEFNLAYRLGVSHYDLLECLPHDEYLGWVDYFERNPEGWREDLRTYYIMTSMSGTKTKPEQIFPSIKAAQDANKAVTDEEERVKAMRSFQASPFASLMAKAKEGK